MAEETKKEGGANKFHYLGDNCSSLDFGCCDGCTREVVEITSWT